MRHLYALAVLLLFAPVASAQWTTQSPSPTHLDARGIAAPTPDRVFLATSDDTFDDGGALFESQDGGGTWTQRDIPFNLNDPLHGVFFLDAQHGWAFGNRNYRTLDGGTTWDELPVLGTVYQMEFFTPLFGVTRSNNAQWISRDGGLSWDETPEGLFDFDFADDQLGLGVAEAGLYRTTDGGASFTLVLEGTIGGEGGADVRFLTTSVALAVVDGTFYRSTDGGLTWTAGASADGRSRLERVSADVALAWGRSGFFPNDDARVLRSTDGGLTWTDLGAVIGSGTDDIDVLSASLVVALDATGNALRSTDGGLTWTQTYTSLGGRPSAFSSDPLAFADTQTGYLAYGDGFVAKTTDGGATWAQISSGTGQSLNDVARFPDGTLIAVGDWGTVLISEDNGPWIVQDTLATRDLVAVDVVDATSVVVADEEGRVYRSSDRGATWTASAATPPNLDAADLAFSTLLDGWVNGAGSSAGSVWHTTDGGTTWTAATTAAGPPIRGSESALDFEGSSGWSANVSGRVYYTTDGGATWIEGDLPGSPHQIRDIDFANATVGYAVGWYGEAWRSSDGGATWSRLPTPNTEDKFTDLYLLGEDELWMSTADDKAYYSATGGQNWAVLEIGSDGFGSFSAIAANPAGDAWTVGFQGYIEHFMGPPPPPENRPPEAAFTFVANGMTVQFTDTSSDPDGTIVSYFWDFGDSAPDSTSTERNPTHTFLEPGTYLVELTVTDDDGATDLTRRAVVAQPNPGGTFGEFTEVTPLDPLFVTPQNEDWWVATTAPADYDGDGDLDLAVLGFYVVYSQSVEYRLVLLTNNGEASPTQWDFTYVDVPIDGMSTGQSDMAWADVDGDTDLDLVVGSDGQTVLFRNDAGTLTRTPTDLPDYQEDNDQADFDLRSLTWADVDNDGDADLLIPSVFDFDTFEWRTKLMRNDGPDGSGGFTFTEVDAGIAGTAHAQSAWADADGDGDLDLLLVHIAPLTDDGFIRLYTNDGTGRFTGEDLLGGLTVEHGEAQWGDYDADGDLDLLIAAHVKETDGTFDQVLRIYRNDGGSYAAIEIIDCAPCEGWFDINAGTWADYDSDGDMDIMVAGTYNSGSQIEGRAKIYTNDGTGVFSTGEDQLPAPRASGDRGGTFSWLDMDNDGDLDYFIAGQYFVPGGNGLVEAQMHLYRNDVGTENLAPTVPTNLAVAVGPEAPEGRTATLTWTPSTDDTTPSSALTYELALFRDGVPQSMPQRLPEPGNVSAVSSWVLTGLEDGHYEWTLRAVDSAFNGSALGTGTFAVGVTTDNEAEGLPRAYAFDGSYPNPFRATTTLRYALPEAAEVEIAVYDLLGRQVVRLVQTEQPAGFYELPWTASSLASGAYLVRFSTDAYVKTQRVVLLK